MSQNGKGSRARSNFSREFRDNYDYINWRRSKRTYIDAIVAGLTKRTEELAFKKMKEDIAITAKESGESFKKAFQLTKPNIGVISI